MLKKLLAVLLVSIFIFDAAVFARGWGHKFGKRHCDNVKERVAEFVSELHASNGKNRKEHKKFRRFIPGKKIGWDERFGSEENEFTMLQRYGDYHQIPEFVKTPLKRVIEHNVIDEPQTGDLFRPGDFVNRAEFCKFLVMAIGIQIRNPEIPSFLDVNTNDWFYPYVETAKHFKWLDGNPDGTFKPGNIINRAEAAKIMVNAFGFEAEDSPDDLEWYDKYIRIMTEKNLLPYGEAEYFSVAENVPRTEMTDQIYRFMVETKKIWDGAEPIVIESTKGK